MVQMDGSRHDWFEGRAGKCVLMVIIDDATNRTYARFQPTETTVAAFDVFGWWIKHTVCRAACTWIGTRFYRDEDHPEKPRSSAGR